MTNLERLSEAPTTADAALAENLIDATPMPELQHNLRLIVDLAEAEIQVRLVACALCRLLAAEPSIVSQTLDRKLRQENDTHTILLRETARLRTEVELHRTRVARAQEVRASICAACPPRLTELTLSFTAQILDAVTAAVSAASLQPPSAHALGLLADNLRALRVQHPEEWAIYGLANVALAQVFPALVDHFAGWSPLEAPAHGVKELSTWRPLLESPAGAYVQPLLCVPAS